ncbi:MAG: hypothetical protein VST69_06865 [Nitrospirota bacterium]|nr:hypothetical protein [Nitrospirota bacterium]
MNYKALFKVVVKHSYYTDTRCVDFAFKASPETAILLKNHRCVLKTQADGLTVLITVDEDGRVFIPLSSGARFLFYLQLQNKSFSYVTDLTEFGQYDAPCFDNQGLGAGELALNLSDREANVSFSVRSPLVSDRIPDAFSEVVIQNNSSLPSENDVLDDMALFEVHFTAKQTRWTYYCVTDFSPASGEFVITDQASDVSDRLSFSVNNRQEFDADLESGDVVARSLSAQYPDKRKIRFLSDQKVSCREAARPEIALYLGENRLSEALPNPPVTQQSNIQVTEESPSTDEETLFQVIKYLSI